MIPLAAERARVVKPPKVLVASSLLTIVRIRVLIRDMYICLCNAVTDHDIRREATDGVQSFSELQARTGCSDCCGTCEPMARATLATAVEHLTPVQWPGVAA
jgi:bacterioferritin-associated ferredoxin